MVYVNTFDDVSSIALYKGGTLIKGTDSRYLKQNFKD